MHPGSDGKPARPPGKTILPRVCVRASGSGRGQLVLFHWMPGATGLVSFGGQPASMPDAMIWAIRNRVEQINTSGGEQLEGLKPGDTVVIQGGAFDGYEAIFDRKLSGNERVRVLLTLLQVQQKRLELPAGQIRKKNR